MGSGSMKKFQVSIALWWDDQWRANLRRSWKTRRYWLAKVPASSARGRVVALQFGAYTVKLSFEGTETREQAQQRMRGRQKVRRRKRG